MEENIKSTLSALATELDMTYEEANELALIGCKTTFNSDFSIVEVLSNGEDFNLEEFLVSCITLGIGVISSKLNDNN